MQAWENFLKSQENEIGIETVNKWLRTFKIIRFDACNLYLESKDSFQAMWFEEHIRKKAQRHLLNHNKKTIKIHLTIANAPVEKPLSKNKDKKIISSNEFKLNFDELNPHFTFENLVENQNHLIVHKIFSEITNTTTLDLSYNPIYLYGTAGTGKTHFLIAAADAFKNIGKKIIYVTADNFTNHVISAIRAGEMQLFRQTYRNIDVLLIDDVHLFAKKGATQEELFHTFNTLHLAGKQIILSANCVPHELKFIEPRLVSRFEWGISLNLPPLTREEIKQVLDQKTKIFNFPLHSKMSDFLIETFPSHLKSLTRALEALILRAHLNQKNTPHSSTGLTIPFVQKELADLIQEEEKMALNSEKIVQAIAEYCGIRHEDILGKAQTKDCVLPRQIAMYLCRSQLKWALMKIGEFFDRHHSTVMTSIKMIQQGIDAGDKEIASAVNAILNKLRG